MLAIILAGVMFPLWPPIMRLGVWYLSMVVLALIGLFFVIAIIRLIFYIITIIVASPGIWIFPKLFADVGFVSPLCLSALSFPQTPPPFLPFIFQVRGHVADVALFRSSRLSRSGNGTSPTRRPRRSGPRRKSRPRASPPRSPRARFLQLSPRLLISRRSPTQKTPVPQADRPV